jgi:hypothetical protein
LLPVIESGNTGSPPYIGGFFLSGVCRDLGCEDDRPLKQFFTAKAQRTRRFAKKIKGLRELIVLSAIIRRVNDPMASTRFYVVIFVPSRLCVDESRTSCLAGNGYRLQSS